MDTYGHLWTLMVKRMDTYGHLWTLMDTYGETDPALDFKPRSAYDTYDPLPYQEYDPLPPSHTRLATHVAAPSTYGHLWALMDTYGH